MDLVLSSADQGRLQTALTTLLSPLEFSTVETWRRSAAQSVKELVGSDTAAFTLPLAGQPFATVASGKEGAVTSYEAYYGALDVGLRQRQAERGLQVYHGLWDIYDDPQEFYRSEFYHDWTVPWGCLDALVMAAPVAQGSPAAGVFCYHETVRSASHGMRGLALLRLLLPAFKAGVAGCVRLLEQRGALASMLDTLSAGALLSDAEGGVLHANLALVTMLEADPEAVRLRAAVEAVASRLRSLTAGSQGRRGPCAGGADPALEVRTNVATYRLHGILVRLTGERPQVLVLLERTTPEWPTLEVLRDRFRLTRREAEVALLTAQGRTNAQIAAELAISRHTALRHAEQVHLKLGIRKRAEVGPTILRG